MTICFTRVVVVAVEFYKRGIQQGPQCVQYAPKVVGVPVPVEGPRVAARKDQLLAQATPGLQPITKCSTKMNIATSKKRYSHKL